jgi:flagella basal body P-ring formation protein FlgA
MTGLSRLLFSLLLIFCLLVPAMANATQVPLPENEIRAAVSNFLDNKLAGSGWKTRINQLITPQGHTVSKGKREYEVIAPANWPGFGAVSIALVVRVNGVVEKNLPLRLAVDAETEMVVAKRQLLNGTLLTADVLETKMQNLALAGGQHIKSIDDAVGKKTRITVRPGYPIRSDQLVAVPVVVSGQLVTIVLERPGMKITVSGRAKSSGGIGDLIRVENLSSRREIPAKVVDSSTVEVGF